jgi:hypothetical protein
MWGALGVLLLTAACGSTAPAARASTVAVVGATSCPADENQDLTFSGDLTGHLSCSTSKPVCGLARDYPGGGVSVDLAARIGADAVQLLVAFGHGPLGTFPAGTLGDATSSSFDGATLDGYGHWLTPPAAGTMTIAVHDSTGASGSIDVNLTMGGKSAHLSGTWRCLGNSAKPA